MTHPSSKRGTHDEPTQNSMVKVKLPPKFLFLSERAKIRSKSSISHLAIQVGHTVTLRQHLQSRLSFSRPLHKKKFNTER